MEAENLTGLFVLLGILELDPISTATIKRTTIAPRHTGTTKAPRSINTKATLAKKMDYILSGNKAK